MLQRADQLHLIRRTEGYLARVLGTALSIHATTADRHFPFLIRDQYGFFEGAIASHPCLFLVVRGETLAPPSVLEKHLKTIQSAFPSWPALLVTTALDSRARARLIAHQIAFVVPGSQLYAPMLAIDLRERLERQVAAPKHFSPSTQLLVLAHLLHRDVQDETASKIAKHLATTKMSMSRAFAEVEALGLAAIAESGAERRLRFQYDGKALWDKALPFLRSPVRKRRSLGKFTRDFPGLLSGEAALAHYTLLAEPRVKAYAIADRQLKTLSGKLLIYYSEALQEDDYILESWSYDPAALATASIVDPLSLYLSVKDQGDERASLAADELLERTLA